MNDTWQPTEDVRNALTEVSGVLYQLAIRQQAGWSNLGDSWEQVATAAGRLIDVLRPAPETTPEQ
jgi:hypothetical protein